MIKNLNVTSHRIYGVSDFLMTSLSVVESLIPFDLAFEQGPFWLVDAAALGDSEVDVLWRPPPLDVEIEIVPPVDAAALCLAMQLRQHVG